MGFGGSSLSYGAPPFPAPTTTASSSSTLSPLAPPFTVDRTAPRPALPYDPYISTWPLPLESSDDCLHHHRRPPSPSPPPGSPPHPAVGAATADALPHYGRPPAVRDLVRASSVEARRIPSLAPAGPYYPCFSSAAATSVGEAPAFYGGRREGTGDGSGYLGSQTSLSNSPFGVGKRAEGIGGSSAWIGREDMAVASGYGAAFQRDASNSPGFVAYEDLQGGWHGKLTESPSEKNEFKYEHFDWSDAGSTAGVCSDLSGTSALAPGASVRVCYPHLSDMHNFVEGSNTSAFNSNDRYICQANTDGADPRAFYPATTYFSANLLGSSSSTSTSMDKCNLKNVNIVQHVNTYKNDTLHRGCVSTKPKEPIIDLNFIPKKDNAGMNREEGMGKIDNANVKFSVVKITLPPSIESAKQISQGYSLGKKSELRITGCNNPGSVGCDSGQSSSERLDENLAEDSPCWKGASSSRRPVSSTFDTLVADYVLAEQKSDGPCKRGSDCPKAENEVDPMYSSGLRKDRSIVMPSKDHRDDFVSKNENVAQAVNEERSNTSVKNDLITGISKLCIDPTQSDSSGFCSLANGQLPLSSKAVTDAFDLSIMPPVISDPSFRSSSLGIDAHVLVKTIHNLSGLLSSSCHFDATLLKAHDKELLWSAISNLEMCISRKSESGRMMSEVFCRSGGHPFRQLSALSEDVPKGSCEAEGLESIAGSVEQSNNRSTCPEQKMHSTVSYMGSDDLDNFLSACGDKNLQKLSGKVMNEKIYEQGEDPQAALYENLWSDVEDAVCLLRYRVQLLRSNIMKDNCKQQLTKDAELEASKVFKLSSQNYRSGNMGDSMPPWNSIDSLSKNSSAQKKHEKVNDFQKSGIMGESMSPWRTYTDSLSKNSSAQGKHENVNNFKKPQQMIVNNFQKAQQMLSSSIDSKVDDIDTSVMTRFKVLKCRNENLNCADVEEQRGQLNSLNVVNDSGMQENICSPPFLPDGKLNLGMKFLPANDAMPSDWGCQQSFHTGRTEAEASGSSNTLHCVADYTEGLCQNSHFSEHRMYEGFYAQGAGGLANQSYGPDSSSGKHFITGVCDGSSDWEHLLEEELTW